MTTNESTRLLRKGVRDVSRFLYFNFLGNLLHGEFVSWVIGESLITNHYPSNERIGSLLYNEQTGAVKNNAIWTENC
jgi:hypothetical protein